MSSKSHWVTELFPPTFRFTLNELEKFPVRETRKDGISNEEEADDDGTAIKQREDTKPLTEFEKRIAHHIAPEDIAAIKNVYQRVWLMNRMKGKEPDEVLNKTGLYHLFLIDRTEITYTVVLYPDQKICNVYVAAYNDVSTL